MISIIFPVFNEQENLEELYQRVSDAVLRVDGHDFEFVFVDDCSADQTPEILRKLHSRDKRVKVIRFARNCGGHAALTAGLYHCKGDCAIALAGDLQDPPELIVDLVANWKDGAKIVWAARSKREGESFSVRFFSRFYYAFINLLTDVRLPDLGADVFLVDRVVIESFKEMPEKHSSIYMTLAWLGFPQTTIEYVKEARARGVSKWSLGKKIKLMLDSVLSFSHVLIRYMSVLGLATAFVGFVYAAWVVGKAMFFGLAVEGWSSLMVAILVIGGVQMMMLGVLGEYLWRTFDESRRRPRFVVEYKID